MSNPNYSLEIISHHPQFDNKSLRKYYVEGIDTIGAWGNEPFEIRFKNNTWQKIQVKLSIDGTDIFTGKPADTNTSDKMWVVNGYETLSIKAWPESLNGGSSFVFTHAGNSVAAHTHGDMTSRGIIAAAVFVQKPESIRLQDYHYHHYYHNPYLIYLNYPYYCPLNGQTTLPLTVDWTCISGDIGGTIFNTTVAQTNGVIDNVGYNSVRSDSMYFNTAVPAVDGQAQRSLESLAAVGAGDHVDQKITYVEGLTKPLFTETIRVRYLWWDDLQAKLREVNMPAAHASGFPGDANQGINLGSTPKISTHGSFRRSEPISYQRV